MREGLGSEVGRGVGVRGFEFRGKGECVRRCVLWDGEEDEREGILFRLFFLFVWLGKSRGKFRERNLVSGVFAVCGRMGRTG